MAKNIRAEATVLSILTDSLSATCYPKEGKLHRSCVFLSLSSDKTKNQCVVCVVYIDGCNKSERRLLIIRSEAAGALRI